MTTGNFKTQNNREGISEEPLASTHLLFITLVHGVFHRHSKATDLTLTFTFSARQYQISESTLQFCISFGNENNFLRFWQSKS